MKLNIIEENNHLIAVIISDEIVINSTQDALDIMAEAGFFQARSIIIREENLTPEFFRLKTRIAGDILQKFSTYRVKIAIVGEFSKYKSNSLDAFIIESNKGSLCFFVPDKETAISKILK